MENLAENFIAVKSTGRLSVFHEQKKSLVHARIYYLNLKLAHPKEWFVPKKINGTYGLKHGTNNFYSFLVKQDKDIVPV